jgi:hypothetical protein
MRGRRYTSADLVEALRALDRQAVAPRRVVIVGGAAVALHTGSPTGTRDIDTWETKLDDLIRSCEAQGIALPPIESAAVGELPWDYDERLEHVLEDLRFLVVLIPEPHDLVLSKTMRWSRGDEEDAGELHAARPLAAEVLVTRYLDEMTHVLGDRSRIDHNVIDCIASLFGEIAAEDARERIARRRR